uniref:hypothetical protein n=1 Tax=Lactobacillus acidophilus TaxID=1579 RepID=UPI003F57CB5F
MVKLYRLQRYEKDRFLAENFDIYSAQTGFGPDGYLNRIDFCLKPNSDDSIKNTLARMFDVVPEAKRDYRMDWGEKEEASVPFYLPRIITITKTETNDPSRGPVITKGYNYFFNDDKVWGYMVVNTYIDPKRIANFSLIDESVSQEEAKLINPLMQRKND